jgi:hypothetical protein
MAYTPVTSLAAFTSPALEIDGWEAPAPCSMEFVTADMHSEDTGRTQDAIMHLHRVRAGIVSLEVSWQGITPVMAYNLIKATSAQQFPITVFDIANGATPRSLTVYRGANSLKYSIVKLDGSNLTAKGTVINLSMSLIQL